LIVCVCRAVCDRRLRALAADGHQSLGAIAAACGAGEDCGTCQPDIEQIITETALVRASRGSGGYKDPAAEPARITAATRVRTAA
jgi:bacterioferritin-associated ferredoxin